MVQQESGLWDNVVSTVSCCQCDGAERSTVISTKSVRRGVVVPVTAGSFPGAVKPANGAGSAASPPAAAAAAAPDAMSSPPALQARQRAASASAGSATSASAGSATSALVRSSTGTDHGGHSAMRETAEKRAATNLPWFKVKRPVYLETKTVDHSQTGLTHKMKMQLAHAEHMKHHHCHGHHHGHDHGHHEGHDQ